MSGLVKAVLQELNDDLSDVKQGGKSVTVQFNPETLKVTFANEIKTPAGAANEASGTAGRQYVGAGTTKLALQLWFDVTAPTESQDRWDDVRRLTSEVVYFMTPQPIGGDTTKLVPPGVRFLWGTFKFDGLVDSLDESLEFFSSDGKPLRASMSLNLSQQKILKAKFEGSGRVPGMPAAPGTKPLTAAAAGATVQDLAAAVGRGDDWARIAAANGIENPRRLVPGQLIDLNAGVRATRR
jgi:hypothetical protein